MSKTMEEIKQIVKENKFLLLGCVIGGWLGQLYGIIAGGFIGWIMDTVSK